MRQDGQSQDSAGREMDDVADSADDMGEELDDAGDYAEKSRDKFKKLGPVLKRASARLWARRLSPQAQQR